MFVLICVIKKLENFTIDIGFKLKYILFVYRLIETNIKRNGFVFDAVYDMLLKIRVNYINVNRLLEFFLLGHLTLKKLQNEHLIYQNFF